MSFADTRPTAGGVGGVGGAGGGAGRALGGGGGGGGGAGVGHQGAYQTSGAFGAPPLPSGPPPPPVGAFGASPASAVGAAAAAAATEPMAGADFERHCAQLRGNIGALSRNAQQITQLYALIGGPRDGHALRERIHTLSDETRGIVRDTSALFRRRVRAGAGGGEDARQRLVQQKLAKEFQEWSLKFQDVMREVNARERAHPTPPPPDAEGARGGAGAGAGSGVATAGGPHGAQFPGVPGREEEEDTGTALLEADRVRQDSVLRLEQEVEFNSALIADQEAGIREIQRSVQDVNEIFVDLSRLVQEQGVMIDNIESNIETAATHVSEGVEHLQKGSGHQRKSRTKLCWLLCIIVALCGAVVLFVFLVRKF